MSQPSAGKGDGAKFVKTRQAASDFTGHARASRVFTYRLCLDDRSGFPLKLDCHRLLFMSAARPDILLRLAFDKFRTLELGMNSLQPRPVLLVHILGQSALRGPEFSLKGNRPVVPFQSVQKTGFSFLTRRARPGETFACQRRPAFQTMCYIRQIPRDQMVLQRLPVKGRMKGCYIYDFIA